MTKQESLNKAAQEAGYDTFEDLALNGFDSQYDKALFRAMDIYAGEKANEAYNQAINHVANFRTLTKEQMEQLQKLVK